MDREVLYGVISDISDPRLVAPALKILKLARIDKLIVNGDLSPEPEGKNLGEVVENMRKFTESIIKDIGESGIESFVQPGAQERILAFEPVMERACGNFNSINWIDSPKKFEVDGHDLVFLPGAGPECPGEYKIGNQVGRFSAKYLRVVDRKIDSWKEYAVAVNSGFDKGAFSYASVHDVKRLVTRPDRTVLVCNIPRRFNNPETGVDFIEYLEAPLYFTKKGKEVRAGQKFSLDFQDPDIRPHLSHIRSNRGSLILEQAYKEAGVVKSLSGFFNMSGHRAHDSEGNPVEQGDYVRELFWNSGHLSALHLGIFAVKGDQIRYHNLDLRDYASRKPVASG